MPSPNVIVAPSFRAIKQRGQIEAGRALGQGISDASTIVANAILQYSVNKTREENERLTLLRDIINTYGSEAGQPALQEYDKLLQKKGIGGLPKDPVTGNVLTPPKTTDQLVAEEVSRDPEALRAAAQKATQGISPLEEELRREEIGVKETARAETERHNRAMEQAAYIRANRTGLSGLASAMPSGFAMGPNGEIRQMQPGTNPPEGFVPLNVGQANAQFRSMDVANRTELNDANLKLKDAELKAKAMELGNDVLFGPCSSFFNYFKAVSEGKIDKKFQEVMEPAINELYKQHGIDPVKEGPSVLERIKSFFKTIGPETSETLRKQIEERQGPAPSDLPAGGPNRIRLKSGAIVDEVVEP